MDEIFEGFAVHFETLRLALAAVNDGRNAARVANLLHSATPAQRPRKRSQWYRFHVVKVVSGAAASALTRPPTLKFKQRSHRRIAVDSLDGFAQQTGHRQSDNPHPVDGRAQDSISRDKFVNL